MLDFDYKHTGGLTGEDMTLDYENGSKEHSGPHGDAVERGVFSNTSHLEVSRHEILFLLFAGGWSRSNRTTM